MECSDQIYHSNDFGFTRKCACQNAVHLVFGNVSLLLVPSQVSDLSAYIGEALMSECGVEDVEERCIYLPTHDQSLMFAMTYQELKKLFDLLDQSLLMMEVENALNNRKI